MARGLRRGPVLLRFRSLVDSVPEAHYVAGIVDTRQLSKVRYTLRDCYLSGLALFFVQDASLLQFQRRFQRKFQANNLSSDPCMGRRRKGRTLLDNTWSYPLRDPGGDRRCAVSGAAGRLSAHQLRDQGSAAGNDRTGEQALSAGADARRQRLLQQLRDLIDRHDYAPILGPCFARLHRSPAALQMAPALPNQENCSTPAWPSYLITLDGSRYFSSELVDCEHCLTTTKHGIEYHHHDPK